MNVCLTYSTFQISITLMPQPLWLLESRRFAFYIPSHIGHQRSQPSPRTVTSSTQLFDNRRPLLNLALIPEKYSCTNDASDRCKKGLPSFKLALWLAKRQVSKRQRHRAFMPFGLWQTSRQHPVRPRRAGQTSTGASTQHPGTVRPPDSD